MNEHDYGLVAFLALMTILGIGAAFGGYPWVLLGVLPFDLLIPIAAIRVLWEDGRIEDWWEALRGR
jgi:hypothetical protein